MAQNTWKNRLISFADSKFENEQYLNLQRQSYNSIEIDLSELEKYQVQEDFTHCENQNCKMVLTNLDKDFIDDWNWVSSNLANYADMGQNLQKMKENKWNYYVWNCRFCSHKNLLKKDKIYFAKSRSKVIIRDGNVDKVNESSLLLFLIDNSSSMQQQIYDLNDQNKNKNNNNLKQTLLDMVKKTSIYQKISEAEKNSLNQIKQKVDGAQQVAYVDFLSKYKVFMSMTEKIVAEICQDKNNLNNTNHSSAGNSSQSKKIGFIFFNSDVILQKMMDKDGKKIIKVSDKSDSDYSKGGLKVDFNNFNQLYHLGKNNTDNYGVDINKFKFTDIEIGNMNPSGQTALGPALAIASGIVSGYAPGSIIIIVTDGKANKGVFGEQGFYQQQIKLLRLRIDQAKAQVCVLKIENKNTQEGKKQKQKQNESSLQRYLRKSGSNLCICLSNQMKSNLANIYSRTIKSIGFTNEIKIKCQNPAVQVKNFSLKKKVFCKSQKQHIQLNLDQNKLIPFDYRHPFMTQILVYYQNINTKQQSKYVTYLMQKIIKYKQMDQKEQKSFNSMQTLKNVLNYLDAEGQKLSMTNIPLSMCQRSFRTAIMESYKHSVRRQTKKQMVLQLANEMGDKTPLTFKTPKDYINSLREKSYNGQEESQDFQKL